MKRKWAFVLAAVIMTSAAGILCFRDALMIRLFPKIVLSNALAETFSQLGSRYASSPVHVLTKALHKDFCQDITLKLDTDTEFLGIAHYDLQLHTQTGPNRIYGDGSISTGAGIMDLQLYLDEDFGAVSSRSLTDWNWYGLTYDSFPEDIRSFGLLGFLAGEETLNGWDASVAGFAEHMRRSYTLPELTPEDVHSGLMAALVLKPQVKAGENKNSYTVTFRAEGDEITETAEGYVNQLPESLASLVGQLDGDDQSNIEVVFALQDKRLTAVEMVITLNNATWRAAADLAQDGQLALELLQYDGENLDRTELTVKTLSNIQTYQESITLVRTINGVRTQSAVDYTWDLSSGDMALELTNGGKKHPVRLNLTGEGESFTVSCQQFETILSLLSGKANPRPAICILTVSPGEMKKDVPEYRNLSDWSMEDLYLLFTRLGGLVGIKLS